MGDPKAELTALVGEKNILDDPNTMADYARDRSFTEGMAPLCLARVDDTKQVQNIVKWANKTKTPLVPVSSGPPHFNGDTVPGVSGAVIVDLSGMKKILTINRRNRMTVIEPGVTYSELMPALATKGLKISNSLLPRSNKSVMTSLLEKEPRLNCRFQWSNLDPLRCLEIIWGDGNLLWTGDAAMDERNLEKQWEEDKWQVQPAGPGQTDFYRFVSAAQGSMGIATWASVRCEVLPTIHKLYFVAAKKLDHLYDFTYKILKYRYADELFILNGTNLANIMSDSPEQIDAMKGKMPPWMTIVGIAGREELPEERVDFQEKDISEIAGQYGLELAPSVPGASGQDVLKVITEPSRDPYWKTSYKGSCQDIFFVTTLDRTLGFTSEMNSASEKSGYPASDIGVYIQPRHQGVNCHCEFSLPYNPDDTEELSRIKALYKDASETLMEKGALFTRPYGIWADMAFKKDIVGTNMLKNLKGIFDPNGVMNPGKLCFKTK